MRGWGHTKWPEIFQLGTFGVEKVKYKTKIQLRRNLKIFAKDQMFLNSIDRQIERGREENLPEKWKKI